MNTRGRYHVATGVWISGFVACVVLSNWALVHLGFPAGPGRPRTIPLGFGLNAPSGVLFAGAMLTIRDVIHERVGIGGTLAVVLLSAPITALTSTPSLAIASVATFVVAEVADLLVYHRLRKRGRWIAVVSSNAISGFIDSAIFLTIAFGLSAAQHGVFAMTLGKLAASLITIALIDVSIRARLPRPALMALVSADVDRGPHNDHNPYERAPSAEEI